MKKNTTLTSSSRSKRVKKLWCPALLFLAGALVSHTISLSARAGSFSTDFNSGLPSGTTVFGSATNDLAGGFTNSGCLKLTTTAGGTGSFVITNDLDAGTAPVSFTARFKALVGGGTGADGFSFNFAPDLPLAGFGEDGAGTGLTVAFDTFNNGAPDYLGIGVRVGGSEIASYPFSGLRAGTFVDVVIALHPDGALDVTYDGTYAFTNQPTGFAPTAGSRFGFGARTGGSTDNHFIDNLSIATRTNGTAYVDYFFPQGRNVRADAPINIILKDFNTLVNTGKITLTLDGSIVTPTIIQSAPLTTVTYQPPGIFTSDSSHTVNLVYADNASPTPNTNTLAYGFTVSAFSTLPTNLVANPAYVSGSQGFFTRYSQIADAGSRDIIRAELQLANLLIDGSTGLPYDNLAAPNPANSTFTYVETNVINYGFPPGTTGNFPSDADVPGVPGPTTGNGNNYAMDAVAYLHLSPGLYTLGVNSSDGFKLTVADSADTFALQEAIFSSVRAAADSTASFAVALDGYYPFRLVYFTGDPAYAPGPGTTLPSLEFFNVDATGNKVLINDTNVLGYVPAFRAAQTKPYVRSVDPDIGETGVPGNSAVTATLVDGSLTVQTNTIALQINGTTVAPTISSNAGVYTLNYQPAAVFAPNSSNYVSLAFSDSSASRRTNTWSFTVANIMAPIWSIAAVNNTWVTAGSTERGLAYNPKTGHLLLVSRAAAPAPAAGLGIAILDSSNGSVIGTLNLGSGIVSGGTFALNIVDVAEDGVIYVCNLSTSAAQNFTIYRWQDESSTPTIAYSAPPTAAAGTPRWGDDFAVRGSGSGTRIIASGNNASANSLPVFTTVDGVNFTRTLLVPTGLANNIVRLGITWGCGDTFYGETTGQPMSYVGFSGVPASPAASLIASYGIYDKNTNQSFGPIAFDIANQRLIGNQTVAPHNINLYDVGSLVATPARNFPIDQRNYASQNTSFGTGFVDFTPDGSRVFCLDTGNGIIAFSLTPRVASINICAQPRTNIVAGIGSLGFMDVTAIGAPQKYQWRFNATNPVAPGTPILNATNRTLDISNVQQSQLGFYSVVISNTALFTSVTSSVAILDTQMVITDQPADQIAAINGSATFNAGATGGIPTLTYQWQFYGTNLPGATASSLTINNAQLANAGPYAVVVRDVLGQTVTSQTAALTVGTVGTGTGLTGDYYSGQLQAFTGPVTLSRVDPTVDFDFGTGSPDSSISVDTFTVRWSGKVQPFYSQTYTFYTTTDDGVRVWVNGQLVINSWVNQGATERSGSIALTAGQKYDITMEYFENTGAAVARLSWSSATQVKRIIPQTQLYPGGSPAKPAVSSSISGTNAVINWSGTFQLQTATNVTGPYVDVPGITLGPYTNGVTTDPMRFFRLNFTY